MLSSVFPCRAQTPNASAYLFSHLIYSMWACWLKSVWPEAQREITQVKQSVTLIQLNLCAIRQRMVFITQTYEAYTHRNTQIRSKLHTSSYAHTDRAPKDHRQELHHAQSGIWFLIRTCKDQDESWERPSVWRKSKPGNLTCIVTAEMKRLMLICSDLLKWRILHHPPSARI